MKYEVKKMKRYAKLIEVHPGGDRSAIAFYDYSRNIWLNAASWSKPSNRLFSGPKPHSVSVLEMGQVHE